MHARLYAEEHGLGPGFESYQLEQLGRFLAGYDPGRDAVLSAADDRGLMASLVVDGAPHPEGSAALRIRWVLLAPRARGLGLGSRLMDRAIAFIDDAGCASWLSTFAGLDTARGLYERRGFRLSEEIESAAWDRPLVMQRFDRPQMPC
ncbi:MAG: GNAT family N-acetyltransferase [Pseudomonadota bacterium]